MVLRETLKTITPYKPGKLKEGAIKLASNENPLGPSPKAIEAIKENAASVNIYPDAQAMELKTELANLWGLETDNFITGNGSDELLVFAAGAYIEKGTNAVTSELTFSEYTFSTILFGGEMRYADMVDGKFSLKALLKLIDENTRIVFLCNPNNPTGTYFSEQELLDFLELVPKQVLVVLDEAYYEYVTAPDYPKSVALLENFPNLLILRTFSKIYGLAALRIGYGIASPQIISDLSKTKPPFNVNTLAQKAALAALNDQEFVKKSLDSNNAGKDYLYKELTAMGLSYFPSQSNFICINIEKDCMDAFQALMEMGITIRPLKGFGLESSIRITIGTEEQNRFFIDCLKKYLQ